MWTRRQRIAAYDVPLIDGGINLPHPGRDIFVIAQDPTGRYAGGNDEDTGRDWDHALRTMATALDMAETLDRIYFIGRVREEINIALISDLNLKFDVSIIGCGSRHHADQPGSGTDLYATGGAMWMPPASPTSATPLLEVYGRGWKFRNFSFDCPVDAAAVKLNANASSGTSEYDASHAAFLGVIFQQGKYAIQDTGGTVRVVIDDCEFDQIEEASGCAIINTSTSVRVPQYWRIRNCDFPGNAASGGNESHIDAPLSGSLIYNSRFGRVEGSGLYIDLTGGDDNIVTGNLLAGSYDTSDYVAGTNDEWSGNFTADISGNSSVDASGLTIAVPAAP